MAAKLFIKTHGCQMNEYDSDRMADLLKDSHALTATDVPDDAEVILINTCSIREKAQEKVFSELGRYKALKESNPNLIIGVGGCVASQEGEAIRQRGAILASRAERAIGCTPPTIRADFAKRALGA